MSDFLFTVAVIAASGLGAWVWFAIPERARRSSTWVMRELDPDWAARRAKRLDRRQDDQGGDGDA